MLRTISQYFGAYKLHKAAQLDNMPRMRKLVDAGADVNEPGPKGATPLFFTASTGSVPAARFLLDRGADINIATSEGGTALHSALLKRHADLALFLIDNGATVNKATSAGVTPLHVAALGCLTTVVERLLREGADVRAVTEQNQGVVYCAMAGMTLYKENDAAVLRLLFAAGADPRDGLGTLRENMNDFSAAARDGLREELETLKHAAGDDALRQFAVQLLGTVSGAVVSPLLGNLVRSDDESFQDWWYSEPVSVPFWNGKNIPVVYAFEPEDDAEFITAADAAVKNFLALTAEDRLGLAPFLEKQCRQTCAGLNLDEEDSRRFEKWIAAADAATLWDHLSPPDVILVQRRHRRDNDVYVQMGMDCEWEKEHGLQLVFRRGRTLTRIAEQDGWLTDADAYGLQDSEDSMLARFSRKPPKP